MVKIKERLKNKKLSVISIGIIAVVILSVCGFMAYQYTTIKFWSNLVYPGVKIGSENLSGKTKDEAKKIVNQKCSSAILKNKLNIEVEGKKYSLNYSEINPKCDVDKMVNEAYSYGKNANFIKKYFLIKWHSSKEFKLKFSYNAKPVEEFINNIEKETNKDAVNATLNFDNGGVAVIPDQKGKKIQKDKLKNEVKTKLNGDVNGDINIKAPIELLSARITADKITSINTKIGSFSTNFGSISSGERANNIRIATKSINGTVLLPGETFSFNDIVGERTAEKGYQSAPVIVGNQVDSGLGGGICQVSSTLYNAVLKANIKATERAPHTLPSHYVRLGLDATVDYESIDYKFKNTLEYPIYIEGDASGGDVCFNIYSNSALANVVTELNSEVYETIQANVRYIDDPDMAEGTTETVQPPSTGYKVKITKVTTKNGETATEVLYHDYYRPVDAVIKRGTKKPIESNVPQENVPQESTPQGNVPQGDSSQSNDSKGNASQDNNSQGNVSH